MYVCQIYFKTCKCTECLPSPLCPGVTHPLQFNFETRIPEECEVSYVTGNKFIRHGYWWTIYTCIIIRKLRLKRKNPNNGCQDKVKVINVPLN